MSTPTADTFHLTREPFILNPAPTSLPDTEILVNTSKQVHNNYRNIICLKVKQDEIMNYFKDRWRELHDEALSTATIQMTSAK